MKTACIDLSYGDCGKARVVGYFAKDAHWTVRFSGGSNAGHTVFDENGISHKLHYISAGGVLGKKVAIDTGTVVNMVELKEELDSLSRHGHKVDLYISENVHMVQPEHLKADADGSGVGSTKKGIAYVYADRALRRGKRITADDLKEYGISATLYRGLPPIEKDENAIFESSQGIMIDIDYGEYPFVTSSSVMPSSVHRIDKFVGVFKAYTTRVGKTKIQHPDLPEVREKGNEYGTTTGRPRMCFWNDMDQLDYAISVVQPDEVVVTKLDVLAGMDICVYRNNKLYTIGSLDNYKNFLIENIPNLRWFSESPDGDLIDLKGKSVDMLVK